MKKPRELYLHYHVYKYIFENMNCLKNQSLDLLPKEVYIVTKSKPLRDIEYQYII